MGIRGKRPREIEETEMTPAPDAVAEASEAALRAAAARAMAQLRDRRRLADVGPSLASLSARGGLETKAVDDVPGDDPDLWRRHGEPAAAPAVQRDGPPSGSAVPGVLSAALSAARRLWSRLAPRRGLF